MIESLPPDVKAILDRYHFDRIPFETLRARIAQTPHPESLHIIREPVAPPSPDAVHRYPDPESAERRALLDEGQGAIARGALGVVILAGGMATRFGSTVKALAPVLEGKNIRFLDVKLADIARASQTGPIDTTIMTSFATDEAIGQAIAGMPIHRAPQFVSLRLRPNGELFRDANGRPSPHATGHGDLPEAMALAGALERLRNRGVQTVLVMNVDNIGATVDPALFALHRRLGAKITVELVSKRPGDKGGMPVVHQGRLVLAEAFRLPPEFPQDQFPLFNTNTLWIDVDALEGHFPWTWCVARKHVEGQEAIQFERLIGELTWWHPTQYVHVPREGSQTRFIPVKDYEDLQRSQHDIATVLRERIGMDV